MSKILIVEDNPANMTLAVFLLGRQRATRLWEAIRVVLDEVAKMIVDLLASVGSPSGSSAGTGLR